MKFRLALSLVFLVFCVTANFAQTESTTNKKSSTKIPEMEDISKMPPPLALPTAGIEKALLTEKKTGMIRIGIAKPKVATPDSKKDPDAGLDIATASANSLAESLKSENVEAIQLETDFSENECKEKGCDYIFYANITQKRGGGMFKKMMIMVAVEAAGALVPGIGGMIASTVASQVMGQTMGKNAKAKDEFTLDYKVVGMDKAVLSQAVTKNKTGKDGEDVLTPQIQQASKGVLGEITKRK